MFKIMGAKIKRCCKGYEKFATYTLAGIILFVAFIYIGTPIIIEHRLNNKVLPSVGSYTGHVDDVDMHLLRGAYSLHEVVLSPKGKQTEAPFFYAREIDIALSLRALFNGDVLVNVIIDKSELNFIDAETPEKRQSGKGVNWLKLVREALPTMLNDFIIKDSKITFRNNDVTPKVSLSASAVNARFTNLGGAQNTDENLAAAAAIEATVEEESKLTADARFSPDNFSDFIFRAKIDDVKLPSFNNFTRAYIKMDFAGGEGDVHSEIKAENGEIKGYVKPLFDDVSVASWEQDVKKQNDNPLQLMWEGLLEITKALLTNPASDKVGSRIEIEGSISDADVESWQAVLSLLRNAFIESLRSTYDFEFFGPGGTEGTDEPDEETRGLTNSSS